ATESKDPYLTYASSNLERHSHNTAESTGYRWRTWPGLLETKPENVQIRVLKAHWTESSSHKAVTSWLCLSTSRAADFRAVCAQDDSMALGARKAFEQCTSELRESWLKIPFLGIDGMPNTGQAWVRGGLLTATVFSPPTAGIAIELMARFMERQIMPP